MRIVEFLVVLLLLLFGCRNNKYTGDATNSLYLFVLSPISFYISRGIPYFITTDTIPSSCAWGQSDALSTSRVVAVVGFYHEQLRIVNLHLVSYRQDLLGKFFWDDDPKMNFGGGCQYVVR